MTVIIDSGAFTAWSQGTPVDLDLYIEFCKSEPRPDFYVALDVIPDVGGKSGLSQEVIIDCCNQSISNYEYMLQHLPQEKIIPVYHQGEPIKYLYHYYDMGARYVGVSTNNNMSHSAKKRWLVNFVRPHMHKFPDLWTHGFGLHSFRLINCFPWYSVDSTAWARQAMTGYLFTPRKRAGVYDYSETPMLLPIAPASRNYPKLSRSELKAAMEYTDYLGMPFGKWEAPPLEKKGFDFPCRASTVVPKVRRKEMVIIEDGIALSPFLRCVANCLYLQKATQQLDITKIYLASFLQSLPYEHYIRDRLFSYLNVTQKSVKAALEIQFAKGENGTPDTWNS